MLNALSLEVPVAICIYANENRCVGFKVHVFLVRTGFHCLQLPPLSLHALRPSGT